jgi:hypothetical protein
LFQLTLRKARFQCQGDEDSWHREKTLNKTVTALSPGDESSMSFAGYLAFLDPLKESAKESANIILLEKDLMALAEGVIEKQKYC